MNKFWIGLLAVGSVFAIDEYKSVGQGTTELDLGYSYATITKGWDSTGKSSEIDFDNSFQLVGIQAKYGITEELDAELTWRRV